MKQERLFKFSFDAFVEQKRAAGVVRTQTVVSVLQWLFKASSPSFYGCWMPLEHLLN